MIKTLYICILCAFCCNNALGQSYGQIYSELKGVPANYSQHCFTYNPQFHELPTSLEQAEKLPLVNLLPAVLCEDSGSLPSLKGAVVAVQRGNCTFSEKASLVQALGGRAVLVVSHERNVMPSANSSSDYNHINITVAVIHQSDFEEITSLGKDVVVQMFTAALPRVDYSLIIIWLLSTGTVAAGSYWSGTVKHRNILKKQSRKRDGKQAKTGEEDDDDDEPETLDISPKLIFVFVILMCGMLLSLYYLFKYLVYIVIGLFTLASSMSLYACLKPIMLRCTCPNGNCRLPSLPLPGLRAGVEVRRMCLGVFCITVAVTWAVLRNEPYAWVLQDLLGIMFCMNMMKTLRLPSLQACSILLTLLFVYDVFFVFITPLFTKDGESIMVQVATGGGSGNGEPASNERLPMVLMVPRFHGSPCSMLPYSMLGFGDILVPGLLISYVYGFDLQVNSGKVYYIATSIGYGIGMVITFVALALMASGQPALLYLVPCTLLPTLAIALKRGEMKRIWAGKNHENKLKDESGTDENDESEQAPHTASAPGISHRANGSSPEADTISNASSNDSQSLLINK